MSLDGSRDEPLAHEKTPENPGVAAKCGASREVLEICHVGDAGLEQSPKCTGKTAHCEEGAAESGTSHSQIGPDDGAAGASNPEPEPPAKTVTDPDLAKVIEAWPDLPEHIRAAVLTLVASVR